MNAPESAQPTAAAAQRRDAWIALADRVARPVLTAVVNERLRATMPVERHPEQDRSRFAYLEAVARTFVGLSPWLERSEDPVARELAPLAQQTLAVITDPKSPDYLSFSLGHQSLVEAAFMAHAILRAPDLLWRRLDPAVQRRIVAEMEASRRIRPGYNNWLLFSAMVETFLAFAGASWDAMRVDYAIRQHELWYRGDGHYSDGPHFHWDYYNSFVIQPMLLDVLSEISRHRQDWAYLIEPVTRRAQRYAQVLERLIAPDGTYPAIGRSITYRCGAFQLLAQLALQDKLPESLPPAQVRAALSAVIHRTLTAPNTFSDAGWLHIGLAGHQPALGEHYITTGSVYLCSLAFLPLGHGAERPFWSSPAVPYTAQRIWAGENLPADHAAD